MPKRAKPDADVSVFCPFGFRWVLTFPTEGGKNAAEQETTKKFRMCSFQEFIDTADETLSEMCKTMGCNSEKILVLRAALRDVLASANVHYIAPAKRDTQPATYFVGDIGCPETEEEENV